MKIVLLCFSALFAIATSAAPAQFTVTTRIFVDGKLVGSPRMTVKQDEAAEVTSASEKPHNQLKVKAIVTISADSNADNVVTVKLDVENSSGRGAIQAHPEILAKIGDRKSVV